MYVWWLGLLADGWRGESVGRIYDDDLGFLIIPMIGYPAPVARLEMCAVVDARLVLPVDAGSEESDQDGDRGRHDYEDVLIGFSVH